MLDFKNIEYLKHGNQKQQLAYKTLNELLIFQNLKDYFPTLTGTIPIEIDTDESDLDIICCSKDLFEFKSNIILFYNGLKDFEIQEKIIRNLKTIVARFAANSFIIEIFGQNRPIEEQESYQHMIIEHRFLIERGEKFRQQIVELKKRGYKTEPAFAELLGIKGDPYTELLKFHSI